MRKSLLRTESVTMKLTRIIIGLFVLVLPIISHTRLIAQNQQIDIPDAYKQKSTEFGIAMFKDVSQTINVTPRGVAAGSVTSMTVVVSEPIIDNPIELKFNRPFIYFIIDPKTSILLISGQYVNPSDL